MMVVAVRIGNRYGPEYEEYLESKLPEYDFIWVRKPIREDVTLQWNKIYGMSLDVDEPICVMDIDVLLTNDYKKIFEYTINGGFFKYYPKECRYIYDEFMSNVDYWQEYYIKNGITAGPVNGEQYFVFDQAKKKLDIKLMPKSWFTRWKSKYEDTDRSYTRWQYAITQRYKEVTGNEYVWMGDWHPDIKLIHFTHSQNKPQHNFYS